MISKLLSIRNKGYVPDAILDIGAHKGWWTNDARQVYGDCKYYLFEATNYPELDQYQNDNNVRIFNAVLNDKVEEVDWYQINGTGDSFFKEKSYHYVNCEPIKRETIDLDSIISQNNLFENETNLLIKIDCQGSEIPILRGSTSILNKTDFIIMEVPFFGQYNAGAPNFLQHIAFMDSIGFIPFDIIESHIIKDFNLQVDLLFINKNHHFNSLISERLLME